MKFRLGPPANPTITDKKWHSYSASDSITICIALIFQMSSFFYLNFITGRKEEMQNLKNINRGPPQSETCACATCMYVYTHTYAYIYIL